MYFPPAGQKSQSGYLCSEINIAGSIHDVATDDLFTGYPDQCD
jgi:hypothetical protein